MSFYREYISELMSFLNNLSDSDLSKLENVLVEAYKNNRMIFVIGNGGSAATASHMANDFSKGAVIPDKKRIKMLSLTDNVSWMTALGNDSSYEDIFVEQLKNFMNPKDVLLSISASGNSKNLVKAIEYSNSIGGVSFSLLGFSGGKMKEISTDYIHIPNYNYGIVEDIHLIINHIIAQKMKNDTKNGVL
jgi:D-sedoheptulose 7-phosphate isomerase